MTLLYVACAGVDTHMRGRSTSTCAGMSTRAYIYLVAFWAQGSFKLLSLGSTVVVQSTVQTSQLSIGVYIIQSYVHVYVYVYVYVCLYVYVY